MHITIIGTGYVGLVTGACLADFGNDVTCVDVNSTKIDLLKKGHVPFYEPGLEELVRQGLSSDRLTFQSHLPDALTGPELLILAVGTPTDPLTGGANLTFLYNAIFEASDYIPETCPILIKCTIPVGTTRHLLELLKDRHPHKSFRLLAHPEFLREGAAVHDFQNPARLIIGMSDPKSGALQHLIQTLHSPLIDKKVSLLITDFETAEIIKYASNSFLATKIAFINEMADLCEATGGNIQQVAHGMGLDSRIGEKFLEAGPGFGGSCFPKDLKALTHLTHKLGLPGGIPEAVITSNEHRKMALSHKIIQAMGGCIEGKTIGILGLTFKANTDDMRDAPSLTIIPVLQEAGAQIRAYDPAGMDQAQLMFENVEYTKDSYDTASGAHAIVILTEWPEFHQLTLDRLSQNMIIPLMIDLRNIFEAEEVATSGFTYVSIGRPTLESGSVESLIRQVS